MDITRYFKKQRLDSEPETIHIQEVSPTQSSSKENALLDLDQPHSSSTLDVANSSEWDIGRYINSNLNDFSKEILLLNCWTPPENFSFPPLKVGKRNLKFQSSWLNQFKWLAYSEHLQGAFCKFCVVFSAKQCGKGGHLSLGALVAKPYSRWKNAKEDFLSHAKTKYHKSCCEYADNFIRIAEGKQQDVASQINEEKKNKIWKCGLFSSLSLKR